MCLFVSHNQITVFSFSFGTEKRREGERNIKKSIEKTGKKVKINLIAFPRRRVDRNDTVIYVLNKTFN